MLEHAYTQHRHPQSFAHCSMRYPGIAGGSLHKTDIIASIQSLSVADLVVLEQDPLQDIGVLERHSEFSAVMHNGAFVRIQPDVHAGLQD